MTKLKTLKDIIPIEKINTRQTGMTGNHLIAIKLYIDLRKEAIKWIKAIDNRMEIGGAFDEFSHEGSSDVPEWIEKFFNITEDDLKNED